MSSTASQALRIWRNRGAEERESRSYLVYVSFILVLVVVVPSLMLLWSILVSPVVMTALLSEKAPTVMSIVTVLSWSASLVLGRLRGPAVRAPLLTSVFSAGPARRAAAFRGPVAGSIGIVVGFATFTAGIVSAAMWGTGHIALAAGAGFVVASLGVGLMAGTAWLLGQIFPRSSLPAAVLLAALGCASAAATPGAPYLAWGWIAAAYPSEGSLVAGVALLVLAVMILGFAVSRMERLRRADLEAQARRWDTAQVFAVTFDLESASAVYQSRPRLFRTIHAVRRVRSHIVRFFLRDALGAIRTPLRATTGAVSMIAAGVIIGWGLTPTAFWGATVGVLVYLGTGPVSDGLRHAVAISADVPLYGISDRLLVACHAVFPSVCALLLVGAGSIATAGGTVAGVQLISSVFATVMLSISVRFVTGLKGPMPIALLSPLVTPVGDLGAITRLIWLFDGLILAALAGLLCVSGAWLMAGLEVVFVAFLMLRRWTRQRPD